MLKPGHWHAAAERTVWTSELLAVLSTMRACSILSGGKMRPYCHGCLGMQVCGTSIAALHSVLGSLFGSSIKNHRIHASKTVVKPSSTW